MTFKIVSATTPIPAHLKQAFLFAVSFFFVGNVKYLIFQNSNGGSIYLEIKAYTGMGLAPL